MSKKSGGKDCPTGPVGALEVGIISTWPVFLLNLCFGEVLPGSVKGCDTICIGAVSHILNLVKHRNNAIVSHATS